MEEKLGHEEGLFNGIRVAVVERVLELMNEVLLSLPFLQSVPLFLFAPQCQFVLRDMVTVAPQLLQAEFAGG